MRTELSVTAADWVHHALVVAIVEADVFGSTVGEVEVDSITVCISGASFSGSDYLR